LKGKEGETFTYENYMEKQEKARSKPGKKYRQEQIKTRTVNQ
jgi:hypothetical protein